MQSVSGSQAKAIESLEQAAELQPNDLRTQVSLARLYMMRNDATSATTHLRLALQTKQYQTDEAGAAIADYFLARALQQQGYDRAAIDEYETLLRRLQRPTLAIRGEPELNDWALRPEMIHADLARLYEKRGDWEKALKSWRAVEEHDSDDFDAHAACGQHAREPRPRRRCAEGRVRHGPPRGREPALAGPAARCFAAGSATRKRRSTKLRRLQRDRPNDRSVLFALADLLSGAGREAEAQVLLLRGEAVVGPGDGPQALPFLRRSPPPPDAMTLLIEASAARPQDASELLPLASELVQPTRPDVMCRRDRALEIPKQAEAAKQFFVASVALSGTLQHRDGLGCELAGPLAQDRSAVRAGFPAGDVPNRQPPGRGPRPAHSLGRWRDRIRGAPAATRPWPTS